MSITRLFQFLTIAALLLMPLGMSGGRAMAAQQATTAAAGMDHCGEADKAAPHHSMPDVDCMAACAAIPATVGAEISAPIPFPAMAEPSPVASLGKGVGPEAAIPPPRIS